MSIVDLKKGMNGQIKSIEGDKKLAKRLLALGFIEGTQISLKTVAPLGDPIVVNLRGFDIAIRKKDAQNIHLMEG